MDTVQSISLSILEKWQSQHVLHPRRPSQEGPLWEAQSPGQGVFDSCVWLGARVSSCPALAHLSFLLIITDLSYPKAWAALLTTDRLSCSQDTQWSGQGGSRAGDTSADERGRTPGDPVGLVNACPYPETLCEKQHSRKPLQQHTLMSLTTAWPAVFPWLHTGSGKENMSWALINRCSGQAVYHEEWDRKTQLAQALSVDAFSSSSPWFSCWHPPRQQLSPSLQWVQRGLYEESGAAIFLDRKGLENKGFCIR